VWWWLNGPDKLLDEADRQLEAANGVPIQWRLSEESVVPVIQELLDNAGFGSIEVVYYPM
jgi:hypothetical protein